MKWAETEAAWRHLEKGKTALVLEAQKIRCNFATPLVLGSVVEVVKTGATLDSPQALSWPWPRRRFGDSSLRFIWFTGQIPWPRTLTLDSK